MNKIGRWTGVVEANGAGKTTLLKLATGLLEPRKGRVRMPADADEVAPDQPTGELNLYHPTAEFLGHLRRVEGVPYTKGELGRRERS